MQVTHTFTETRPTGYLRPDALPSNPKDGDHVVADEDGCRLVARVRNGVVEEWIGIDRDGSEVRTMLIRSPSVESAPKAKTGVKQARRKRKIPGMKVYAAACASYATHTRCWWVRIK